MGKGWYTSGKKDSYIPYHTYLDQPHYQYHKLHTNIFLIEDLYYIHMYYTTLTFPLSIGSKRENYIGIKNPELPAYT